MRQALDVFWQASRDWWNSMVGLASLNLLWLVISLTVVLFPPATAGMHGVTYSIARGKGQHIEDFWGAARRYAALSWLWAGANLLVIVIVYADVVFYNVVGGIFGLALQVVLIGLGLLWMAMQFYFWPFMMVQEDKRFWLALRNAAFLALGAPLYTLLMVTIAGLILIVSGLIIVPFAVFTLSFISLLGNHAVVERLSTYGKLAHTSGEESCPNP
jgi:hypothetical protein